MMGDRQRLHALAVDERAIPEFEIQQRPDRVATAAPAGAMIVEQPFDGCRVGDAALARAAVEEDVADHAIPGARRPAGERYRKAHFPPRENRLGDDGPYCFAQDALRREAG